MIDEDTTALIATYIAETAANITQALESIYSQSLTPAEVVIVIDGPIDQGQKDVIASFVSRPSPIITKVVTLDHQQGLAAALNAGLAHCTRRYVMRMDSDDICHPQRLLHQAAVARSHPEFDVIASWAGEFIDGEDWSFAVKEAPGGHDEILRALKWRNVLCHPSVLMRREAVMAVGGYRITVGRLEDYDLFVRMAVHGARFHVIPRSLVYVRVTADQRRRRGGIRHLVHDLRFRFDCRRRGFLTWRECLVSAGAYTVFRLIPAAVRGRLYQLVRTPQASALARP